MIVLFIVVSFVVGCVDRMCQPFLSECAFVFLFSVILFWPCRYGFLTFPSLCEISFSSQMISGTVSCLLGVQRILK